VIIWDIYFIKILHRLQIKICLTCKCCKISITTYRMECAMCEYHAGDMWWYATDIYLQKASFSLFFAKQLIALQRRKRRDDDYIYWDTNQYTTIFIHNIHFFYAKRKVLGILFIYWMNRLDSRESLVKVHDFLFPSLLFDLLMYLLPIRLNFQRKNTQFLQRKNKEKFDTC